MGSGASKAAARAYQAAEPGGKAAAQRAAEPLAGSLARDEAAAQLKERARGGARIPLTLEEEERLEAKDASLDKLLSQIGGAITGTRIEVAPPKSAVPHTPKEVSLEGRLPPDALRELFRLQAAAEGGPLQLSHLVAKHKPDPELLQRVLSRACLPQTMEAQGTSDVQVFADWPSWFRRRRS